MTLVSTSRKAAPGIRALARGLAFALEGRYMARGKTGLRELVTLDRTLSLFILETDGLRLRIFQDGEVVLRITPTRRARALKWTETETEPTPPKPDRG